MTEIFDFIVVGAGSGGAAVAGRLSESGNYSVLLIEPGEKTNTFNHNLPLGVYNLVFNPRWSWQFQTGPETALGGYKVYSPRGRGLGGSSSINGMIWTVGSAEGWDEWVRLGHKGWGWDDVQPVFRKLEGFSDGGPHRGQNGPMHIEWQKTEKLGKAFLKSCEQAGYPKSEDYNSGNVEGYTPLQTNTRHGWRWSTYKAYLEPAAGRKSLEIRTGLHADRLILKDGRVTGVNCLRKDGDGAAAGGAFFARREVILAAGAYHTPLLLERSGIGDPDVLRAAGIEVEYANPHVGAHLLDHMRVCVSYRVRGAFTINDIVRSSLGKLRGGMDFFLRRRGWLRTATMNAQMTTKSGLAGTKNDLKLQINAIGNDFSEYGQLAYPIEKEPGLSLLSWPVYPRSRGHIHLAGRKPWDHPEIFTNFLSDEYDQQVSLRGLRLGREIARQPALSRYLVNETFPGIDVTSDNDLLAYAKGTGLTVYHPAGTCRMGELGQGVVDNRLKAHGVEGLRLADASIMPTFTASNTNAPTILIGERAAIWALEDAEAAIRH